VIAAVLLAAGSSRRFGSDKLRQVMPDGATLLEHAIRPYVDCVDTLTLVVHRADELHHRLAARFSLRLVESADAHAGMGHSLSAGVSANPDADAWIIGLADMPKVRAASVSAVACALRAGKTIVTLQCQGQRGHPVGFSKAHGPALVASQGDTGARHVLAAHAQTITLIDTQDSGILVDVDWPSDLASLRQGSA
jgi:molybdenum cofactor cytidylyltransferase